LAPKADELVVVAPDKGAVKRATLVAESLISLDTPERILFGEKVRDPGSGEILETLVLTRMGETFTHLTPDKLAPFPLKGKPMLIVDDICDGGRTFIELAKVLREFEPSEIILYVTHGIFSKGFEVFKDQNGKPLIDQFLIANPFKRCLDWVAVDGVKFISDPTKTSFICLEFP
jgi:ribose-phosphate pyrophosphokinase